MEKIIPLYTFAGILAGCIDIFIYYQIGFNIEIAYFINYSEVITPFLKYLTFTTVFGVFILLVIRLFEPKIKFPEKRVKLVRNASAVLFFCVIFLFLFDIGYNESKIVKNILQGGWKFRYLLILPTVVFSISSVILMNFSESFEKIIPGIHAKIFIVIIAIFSSYVLVRTVDRKYAGGIKYEVSFQYFHPDTKKEETVNTAKDGNRVFVGATKNYVFLHDKILSKSYVYETSRISELVLEKKSKFSSE